MITFSQLKCFLAVAEHLNFRRAAQHLNMTQPPLTRQIQALEHQVGAQLLDRGGRAITLTAAGQHFLRAARHLVAGAEEAVRDARRVAGGDRGALTVAFTATSSYRVLPRVMALLRENLGEVSLTLREMTSAQQLAALREAQVDIAICRPIGRQRDIESFSLYREPLCAAVPRDHPLARCERVVPSDLEGQTLVTYPPVEGYYLHDLIIGLLNISGVTPADIQHVTQTHSILALVGAGFGIGLVPASVTRLTHADVVLKPLQAPENVNAELMLAWRSDGLNPVARLAVASIRSAIVSPDWLPQTAL